MKMKVEIKPENGHYAVYLDDEFYCSADTYEEAKQEVKECMIERVRTNGYDDI